jgi:hypothetical protein
MRCADKSASRVSERIHPPVDDFWPPWVRVGTTWALVRKYYDGSIIIRTSLTGRKLDNTASAAV